MSDLVPLSLLKTKNKLLLINTSRGEVGPTCMHSSAHLYIYLYMENESVYNAFVVDLDFSAISNAA